MKTNNRILIIDDDPGIRDAYRAILEPAEKTDVCAKGAALFGEPTDRPATIKERYTLTIVERGDQGTAAVEESLSQKRPFAMAFIDMMMPGMDGAETARLIWQLDPRIKITIVTAYSEHTPDDIIRVTGRNDLFYLRKPFNPEEIRQFARALTHAWNLEWERGCLSDQLKEANTRLADMNRNLEKKVQDQTALLIQSEKMASIGLLAAGVAHEINNPISYVNGNLSALKKYGRNIVHLLQTYRHLEDGVQQCGDRDLCRQLEEIRQFKTSESIDFILEDIDALVDESLEGVDRVRKIVMDLKTFSRIDETESAAIDINACLDATLNIIWNEIKYHAEVIKAYEELPEMIGYPQKISQVFMNILINAAKAISGKGTIHISTRYLKAGRRRSDERIVVAIADDGMGIPAALLGRIFDPFFTTKPVGEGIGLGLSISYDIIKAHGGTIRVASEEGKGTAFTIDLPVAPTPQLPIAGLADDRIRADRSPKGEPSISIKSGFGLLR
jgi:two-component system, NtrC family, sensor kinase